MENTIGGTEEDVTGGVVCIRSRVYEMLIMKDPFPSQRAV